MISGICIPKGVDKGVITYSNDVWRVWAKKNPASMSRKRGYMVLGS